MKQNQQKPAKLVVSDGGSLLVHSIFPTIQGEGPNAGRPAVFVRLAECNLQCPECDTEYTEGSFERSVDQIFERVITYTPMTNPNPLVVITGGEPFRQNISPLCKLLLDFNYHVQIETNGTLPPPPDLPIRVIIVCSPKTGSINRKLLTRLIALKYVLTAGDQMEDGLPQTALGHTAKPYLYRAPKELNIPIYLQPADHQDPIRNAANLAAVIDSCMTYGYTLCLQQHKIIDVE